MIVILCFFIPESPRYLLMKGRVDEARDIVYKLHRMPNDPDQEFARAEFYQMSKQAEIDRTMDPGWVSLRSSTCDVSVLARANYLIRWSCSGALHTANASFWAVVSPSLASRLVCSCSTTTVPQSTLPSATTQNTNSSSNAAGSPSASSVIYLARSSWTGQVVVPF